ncbi:Alpha/Beta hydrolase protein [Hyaloraphidium curvatum]|nr:Alpha/Beta hydrolase protein [Hyaloraphidium curvatum]
MRRLLALLAVFLAALLSTADAVARLPLPREPPRAHRLAARAVLEPRQGDPTTVRTQQGDVVGVRKNTTRSFLNIPYAQPPQRWTSPVYPPAPWEGARNATAFGPCCAQNSGGETSPCASVSEDCLYLNVYSPDKARCPASGCPVLVWLHGGHLMSGSANFWFYDGSRVADVWDVVVVGVNYRLNAFGFLGGDAILAQSPAGVNFGMQDQIAALRWLQDNVAAFNGDPRRVTVFGESAGAVSIGYHILNRKDTTLFSRAIMQSGTPETMYALTMAEAEAHWKNFTSNFNTSNLAPSEQISAMRNVSMERILEVVDRMNYGPTSPWGYPTIDGKTVRDDPRKMLRQGGFPKLDGLLLGDNDDEGSIYAVGLRQFTTEAAEATINATWAAETAAKLLPLYRNFSSAYLSSTALISDAYWFAPGVVFAQEVAGTGVPSYKYRLGTVAALLRQLYQQGVTQDLGIFHGADIPFVWYIADLMSPAEKATAAAMAGAWARFAQGLEPWPRYNASAREVAYFRTNGAVDVMPETKLPNWRDEGIRTLIEIADRQANVTTPIATTTTRPSSAIGPAIPWRTVALALVPAMLALAM